MHIRQLIPKAPPLHLSPTQHQLMSFTTTINNDFQNPIHAKLMFPLNGIPLPHKHQSSRLQITA